jgi:glucose/mannose-6-phosphate isomerase
VARIDLDDLDATANADPADMLGAVERSPEQWREGMRRAETIEGPLPEGGEIEDVVVCGMGGSGIAGDVLQAVAARRTSVPVAVVKGYAVPAYVGPLSFVIAVSYSGNTEETLACFDEAVERGARLAAVATGGLLAERAGKLGAPCVRPVEGLQPRAGLPSLAAICLVLLERAGILEDCRDDFAETEELLAVKVKEWGRDREAGANDAKRLASGLVGLMPHLWGQEGELAVAALRWRCQLNENAKVPAFEGVLPELDHNEIAGYDPGLPLLEGMALVVLRAAGEDPRVAKRIEATLALVRDRYGRVEEAWAAGQSPLARLMTSALLGDFVSVYLALLRGVDPTPVDAIERLKRALS